MFQELSQERIKELLIYDQDTGVLSNRVNRASTARQGEVVGNLDKDGYLQLYLDGKMRKAHRLVWLYVHGHTPNVTIDHINGDRADNRVQNLRLATQSENCRNKKKLSVICGQSTSSTQKGVSWHKRSQRWRARLKIHGKEKYLGTFTCERQAAEAYNQAAQIYHGEFAKVNSL